jgi:hypothetical protein
MLHSSAILGILEKLMRIFEDPYWWTVALSSVVQLTMFGRWIYRRIRNDEMMRAFVEDMAKIHLPHTYALLEGICDRQGIKTPEVRKSTGSTCTSPAVEMADFAKARK